MVQPKDLERFRAFLKNEPVMAVLNRNLSFLLDQGKRIQSIEINDKMQSYTDGKKVVISGLPPLITPDYDRRAWIIMMRVALAHEVQHDNSSDFNLIKEVISWYSSYMRRKFQIREEISADIAQSILNCMEDGRIDEIIVQRFPGYLGMMRMVNFAIREESNLTQAATDSGQELIDFQNQILSYSITGLNLPGITVYHGKRMEAEFMKIRPFIDQGVASPTAKGCFDACKKVLETSAPYIADLVRMASNIMDAIEKLLKENYSQSDSSREEETGNPGSDEDGDGNSTVRIKSGKKSSGQGESSEKQGSPEEAQDGRKDAGEKDVPEKQGGGSRSQKDTSEKQEGKSGSSAQGGNSDSGTTGDAGEAGGRTKQTSGEKENPSVKSSGNKNPSRIASNDKRSASERAREINSRNLDDVMGAGFDEEQSPPATEEELQDMLNAAADELQRAAASIAAHHVEKGTKTPLSRDDIASLKEKYHNLPQLTEKFVIPTQQPVDPMILSQAKRLHEKLATILMKRRVAGTGFKKGYIDPNKLWRVGVGDENIFQRKDPPKLSDCVVYELIDGSGSMSDTAYRHGNTYVSKLISALTTASIMEEALKGLSATKVTIFRAGWGGHVEHVVIKDFNQKPYGSRCFDAMSVVSPSSGNMDGFSIRIAAMDLAKRPEKNKILIVLSDGLPSAYSSNKNAIGDVRSAVKWARMHGVTVISIMFGEENFLKSNYASYKEMYEQDIIAVKPVNINREFELLLTRLIK